MKRKRQQPEQPVRPDGVYWLRLFIPLRGGHYNREFQIVSIEGGKVRFVGSDRTLPQDAQVLNNALWVRIEPPPLVEPPQTALAVEKAGNRQKRRNRRARSDGFTHAEKTAVRIRLVAEGIVTAFVQTSDDLRVSYAAAPQKQHELVQQVAGLLEQAFGSRSITKEP